MWSNNGWIDRGRSRVRMAGLVLLVLAANAFATPAVAQGTCQRLWVERNSIYKRAGYCFKTARARSYFGNAGCLYDSEAEVPLGSGQRARIARISRLERQLGCSG